MGRNSKDTPLVVNLTQEMKLNPNYHIGAVDEDQGGVTTRHKGGVTRKIVNWRPRDAVKKDVARNKVFQTSVKPDNVLSFGPGVLGPRQYYWLLPDGFQELPNALNEPVDTDTLASVGLFFQKAHYQKQAVIKALEIATDQEAEIVDKIRHILETSELDDKQLEQFVQQLERFKDAVNSGSGNKSDSNSS